MKRYQILPVRYMSPENEVVNRFLIYHSPGTGKSFTALWIALKFINVYKKPCIILVKGKEAITEFTKTCKDLIIKNLSKSILNFARYITFCNDIKNINDINTDTDGNDNKNLVKLIKPNLNSTSCLTPEKLKEEMLGHLSYYGLNPPNTTVNYMGSYIPGIERYKIVKVPMQGVQLQNYRNILKEPQEKNNMGINYVKATLGVLHLQIDDDLTQDSNKGSKEKGKSNDTKKRSKAKGKSNDAKKRSKSKVKSELSEYQFSNDKIIHSNPLLQDIIMQQSKDIKNYCYGPVFIYCSIIEQIGIYYFSAILCAIGYHYVYNK
ncbi:hypothetical protein H8356DRAFT_1336818, partial [Neocallimastix lanati (nom. inval.)]